MKKIKVLALATLFAIILVGCGNKVKETNNNKGTSKVTDTEKEEATVTPNTSSENEKSEEVSTDGTPPVITVRAAFATGMTGVINQYAIANGLYEKEGIIFDVVLTDSFVAAFAAGEIDFADSDPGTFVQAAANGVPLKMVGNMWRSKGAYWIVAREGINSLEELKGKVVGTASTSGGMRITAMEVLKLAGLDPNSDVELIANGTFRNAYATLVSGEVDATIIHQPFATIAELEGVGKPIAQTWKHVTDYYTGTIVASDDYIENQPENLQRVVTAYYKVHEYVKNHKDEFYPWAAEFLGVDIDILKTAMESEIELWTDEPVIDPSRLQKTVDMLIEYGFLREGVDIDDTYDNQFATVAAKELGLE